MHKMKHFQQEFLQREQGLTKYIEKADKSFITNNINICKLYFVTLVAVYPCVNNSNGFHSRSCHIKCSSERINMK